MADFIYLLWMSLTIALTLIGYLYRYNFHSGDLFVVGLCICAWTGFTILMADAVSGAKHNGKIK